MKRFLLITAIICTSIGFVATATAQSGQPLTKLPITGSVSTQSAKQDIPLDLDYLRSIISRADDNSGEDVYGRVALSRLQDLLQSRAETLAKRQLGQSVLPAAVQSPGPKYRAGMSGEDIVKGMFKASNWKSGNELSPMRINKKACKAGSWEKYGVQHGSFGADAAVEIATATKKCAKHKVIFDEVQYRAGFKKAISDYCGYERGFFAALRNRDGNENCTSGTYPNYTKGIKHGKIRTQFTNIDSDFSRTMSLYKGVVRYYNSGKVSNVDTILPEIDIKHVFGNRKYLRRFIANEEVRLGALKTEIQSHKAQYPELYQFQEIGIEPRPDNQLDYPIPH